jgi:murein DD-endopeptidase MepM/ murein hydrolase activator NlpD
VRSDLRAKMRDIPALTGNQVAILDSNTAVTIIDSVNSTDGETFKWIKVNAGGTQGYIREDLLTYSGDCSSLGLTQLTQPTTAPVSTAPTSTTPTSTAPTPTTPTSTAPATGSGGMLAVPVQKYTIGQYYGDTHFGQPHKGTDFDVPVGTQIIATASGTVAFITRCSKCDTYTNFSGANIQSWDANAIKDPTWGYGFGNYVCLCYPYSVLPASMRAEMDRQGMTNGYAYVIHAHMSQLQIDGGAQVHNGSVIGLSGNTGNSTGPHLHLEVHISKVGTDKSTYGRPTIDPRLMYDYK